MRSKKLAWLLALILVAVLSFTLIGCKPKVDDDDEKKELTTTQIVEEVSKKLGDDLAIANPRTLNIDIQGSASLQENVENGLFWKYELIAKGNINLSANAKEDQSNFRIEVNAFDKEGKKSTLISLLYESEMDANGKYLGSYFYLTLPGQDAKKPLKINAISLLKLIPGVDEEVDEINIGNYLGIGLELLTESADKVGDNSYKLNTNMAKIWDLVQTLVVPLIEKPEGELIPGSGIDIKSIIGEIDKVIPEIFPGLTYKGTNEAGEVVDVAVDSVLDLIAYVDENLPTIDISATFNFDANDGFTGAELVADYRAKDVENATHKFTLDIDALQIAAGSLVAYDDGYALTATQRKEMAPTGNILTFSIDGKMTFVKGSTRMPYTIDINADINPFVLVDGFDISKLKDIGSLSMIISDDTTGEVIFTLYINGEDKELIISYDAPGSFFMIVKDLHIGGEYSFDALGAIINAMSAPAEASLMADEAAGQDVAGLIIKALFDRLNFDNLATTGVVFNDMKGLIDQLLTDLNVDLGNDLIRGMLPGIVNDIIFRSADFMEIGVKENGFKYGSCEIADKADLKLPGHSNGIEKYDDLLDDTKSVSSSAVQTNYEYGESFKVDTRGASGTDVNKSFTISGKNKAGENADYSAVYYDVLGYDPYKVGTQEVTIFYGINSMLGQLLNVSQLQGVMAGLPALTPLFGAHMFKMNVTVYPKVDPANVVLAINGSTTMFVGEDIAEQLNAVLRYQDPNGNRREVAVTNDMISCKKPVVSGGSFELLGKYTLNINYKGITTTQNVTVNEIAIEQADRAKIGSSIMSQISSKIRTYNSDGEIVVGDIKLTVERIVDSNGNVLEGILDEDSVVLADFANRNKKFSVDLSYTFNGATRITTIECLGTNAQDIAAEVSISSMATSTQNVASNMRLTAADYARKHVSYVTFKIKDSAGKEISHAVAPVWDETTGKIVMLPYSSTAKPLPADFTLPKVSVEFTRVGDYVTKTDSFEAMETPGTPFNLDADHLTLAVGSYQVKTTIGDVYTLNTVNVKPFVIFKDYDSSYGSSLFNNSYGIILSNIYTKGFEGCPTDCIAITMKWDPKAKAFKPIMKGKDVEGKAVEVPVAETDFKFEMLENTMYDTATSSWITARYTDTGAFEKETVSVNGKDTSRYRAYKATVKIIVKGQAFEGSVFVNTKNAPADTDPVV